jgi:hypothetical protein
MCLILISDDFEDGSARAYVAKVGLGVGGRAGLRTEKIEGVVTLIV